MTTNRTVKCADVHTSVIPGPCIFWRDRLRKALNRFRVRSMPRENAAEDSGNICIYRRSIGVTKCECGDGVCGVVTNSGKLLHRIDIVWKLTAKIDPLLRNPMKHDRTTVVPKALPQTNHVSGRRF